jgi:four helix bundle protein
MATYKRFEDLPVWQTAAELYERTDDLIESAVGMRRGYRDQLERASLSISNNIAEGFERGTTKELLNFIYIARGSAAEVRSMAIVGNRRVWLIPHSARLGEISRLAESCSRQLRAWADSLQNGDIAGPRHLNDKTKSKYAADASRSGV